jgi:signal transduction histidine kinase/HPt (histidine-containing phosphotransfer) domain-containing protein
LLRVLLIEGDADSAGHMDGMAKGENESIFTLEHVASLAEAQERLRANDIDAILASLDLPDSNGFRTFLRLQVSWPHIPIIVLGDSGRRDLAQKVIEQGAQDYLVRGVFGAAPLRRMLLSAHARQERLNALRGREDLVRNLTMMNVDGILIVDDKGYVRFSNPVAETMFQKNAANGARFGHDLDTDKPTEIELKDGGKTRVLEARSARIRWKNTPSLLVSVRDVSAHAEEEAMLRTASEAAESASRAKSSFVANMSHEIRTPINSLLGMTELLSETQLSAEQKECVEVLQRSGSLLLSLINNILDLSKIEAGHLEIEKTLFDLKEELAKIDATLGHLAQRKGVTLKMRLGEDVAPWRRGDVTRIGQVLINLVNNAIKFTQEGSVTLAVTEVASGKVRFAVEDTGIGIPKGKQARVFQSFRQADSSTTRRHGGTGLGLAISKMLVEAMGGALQLESEVGRGSIFSFEIPLPSSQKPRESAAKEVVPESAALPPAARLRILLVDDAPDNRLLIQRFLRDAGHMIVEAVNGREAVELWSQGTFDVILMDVQMPEVDGLTAARMIRALEKEKELERTRIVAVTATATSEAAEQCRAAGCDSFLTKPIRKADLLSELGHVAGGATGVDPEIADLIPGYIQNRHEDLVELEEAADSANFTLLADIGHRIKGSAGGYGFDGLALIAADIEKAGMERRGEMALKAVRAMRGYLDKLEGNSDG